MDDESELTAVNRSILKPFATAILLAVGLCVAIVGVVAMLLE